MTIYTYTSDLTRPLCPTCGNPVPQDTDTPDTPWNGTCSAGHSFTFQLEDDVIYVYDDEGTLDSANVAEFGCEVEAALSVIDSLIEWTKKDAHNHYDSSDIEAHLTELNTLKLDVKSLAVEVSEPIWYQTNLGFTFGVK
ncbi:hypothetical protein [Vibrio sp. YT-17]|uniref:hypothetical protein n=1 Tax=Vibrio sp. YT-17 TaxID=3074708 RepID=UPI00296497F1|nr:hypothetical protein [Vibrio sp. YT-17]MDW1542413.1 hypothetical protein [Vibrio sp. YT-17]